jgi:hypothetical protein
MATVSLHFTQPGTDTIDLAYARLNASLEFGLLPLPA